VRNHVRLLSGIISANALASAVSVLASPVLARLYGPEAFMVQGVITATSGLFAVAGAFRYEQGIIQAKSVGEVEMFRRLSYFSIAIIFIGLVGINLFRDVPAALQDRGFSAVELVLWCAALYLSASFGGVADAINVYTGSGRQAVVAGSVRVGVTLAMQLLLGFAGASVKGLLIGQVLGQLTYALYVHRGLRTLGFPESGNDPNRPGCALTLRALAWQERRFPLYLASQSCVSYLSHTFPVWALGQLGLSKEIGFFWFFYRMMLVPHQIIGKAIRNVFTRFLITGKEGDSRSQRRAFYRASGLLMAVAIVSSSMAIFLGKPLVGAMFGHKWQEGFHFLISLLPWWVGVLVSPPSLAVIRAAQMDHWLLVSDCVGLSVKLVLFWMVMKKGYSDSFILSLSIVALSVYLMNFFMAVLAVERKDRNLCQPN
jgi:O-antigen/teichoic acid export membrane protein